MGIVCDGSEVTKLVNEFGTSVGIRVVNVQTFATRWGDATESITDYAGKKAIVWVLGQDTSKQKEGELLEGDIIFIFDNTNEGYCIRGNYVNYDSTYYEILNVRKTPIGGTTYTVECITKKA